MSSGRLADFEARLAAQTEFGRPFALEAGAGTGKTAALVARIVAWCTGPGWEEAAREGDDGEAVAARVLDGVVAITFSEAAAAEMAARTAEALAELRQTDPFPADPGQPVVTGLYRAALPAEEGEVRRRAGLLLTELERLRTGTIHAFARSILARFPVEAGIRPGFEVDPDGEAIRELVDEAVATLLLPRYRHGDDAVMELAARGLGPAELAESAASLEREGVSPAELERDPFTAEVLEALLGELARHIVPCREDAAAYAAAKTTRIKAGGELLVKLAELLEHGGGPPLERLQALAALVADPGATATMKKLDEWASGKCNKPEPAVLGCEEFRKHLAAALPHLEMLRAFDPDGWRLLATVLAPVLEAIDRLKRRHGLLGFADLLRLARRVLEDDPGVRRRIRSEIRQLLVDEMQDTDPEQARIVELVALEDDPGPRPCLFLVGDPKQSIYAFRGADFGAYQRLVAAIRRRGGAVHRLGVNFRSVPAILDEVERIVAPSMNEEPGIQAPFEPLSAGPERAGEEGFTAGGRRPVEHWLAVAVDGETGNPKTDSTVETTTAIEAHAVVEDILDLHDNHGVSFSDMAILMRTSTHMEAFLEALREAGVPYEVGKDRSFYRTREVTETIALVRTVLDPDDALALMAVLRSPFAGVPDAALRPLWNAGLPRLAAAIEGAELSGEIEDAVRRAAERTAGDVNPLEGWPGALLAFLGRLGALRRSFACDPPDRFVELLRRATLAEAMAAARFPGRYRLANVERFLGRLAPELARASGAEAVLRWLRRVVRERPDETSARPRQDTGGVRVMTVHGAKGLGFAHLWIVQTAGGGTHRGEGGRTTAVRRSPGGGPPELRLAGIPTPGWAAAGEAARAIQEAEELRLLYVALTRAKVRVVTVGAPQHRKNTTAKGAAGWYAPGGTFLAWMTAREGGWFLDPEALAERMDPGGTHHDGDALWRLPVPSAGPRGARQAPARSRTADALLADRGQLATLRRDAAARQARPWLGAVSHEAHRQLAEAIAAAVEGVETLEEEAAPRRPAVSRDAATAAGTAVHRVLERLDPGAADPAADLHRHRAEAHAWLETAVPAADLPEARERLDAHLETFRTGPLWERFLGLRGHILARELPVLLPPPADPTANDDPVGAYHGVIDLLYRDPATGELVVADYKTDDPNHIEDRTEAYRTQLALYARAVQQALALAEPPRTELWFLAASRVVLLDTPDDT